MQVHEKSIDSGRSQRLSKAITQSRLILAAMATGVLGFAAIALGMNATRGPLLGTSHALPQILAGLAMALLVGGVGVGVILARRLDAKSRNLEQVQIEQITGAVLAFAALVEGPSLLAAVAALLGGVPYLLITVLGSAVLLVQWIRLPDRMREMGGLSETSTWRYRG